MSEFDWSYPSRIDRELVEELFTLKFLAQHSNVVLLGANGLGKTMIAKGIGHQALLNGYKARFVTASHMLGELATCDGASSRDRCFKKYAGVDLLILDEVGYLSYDNRYVDLLYEVVTARYEKLSTIVTTNRPFKEWGDIFPNTACVVTLVDRLMHNCEIVLIEAQRSYRHKEAEERSEEKQRARKAKAKDTENKKERGRQK